MPRIFRSQADTRSVIEPEPGALGLLLRYLQTFSSPDAFHPLEAHMPTGITQQRRHPAIAIATILPGQGDNVFGQGSLVIRPTRHLALCRSMLPEHAADPPLGHRHHGPDMIDTAPAARGAQKFPREASCRINLSNVRSDTALRNRAFSFSSSFIRRA